jgi:thiamine phosphate synthase YjbQ (UPF0047 family)
MGREVVVAVTDGKLDFGTWEQIFYGEFEGMRDKRMPSAKQSNTAAKLSKLTPVN